jgi:hypothetical protein
MKTILQFLILLCVISTTKAQTFTPPAFADVDNNYRTYVNQVFCPSRVFARMPLNTGSITSETPMRLPHPCPGFSFFVKGTIFITPSIMNITGPLKMSQVKYNYKPYKCNCQNCLQHKVVF